MTNRVNLSKFLPTNGEGTILESITYSTPSLFFPVSSLLFTHYVNIFTIQRFEIGLTDPRCGPSFTARISIVGHTYDLEMYASATMTSCEGKKIFYFANKKQNTSIIDCVAYYPVLHCLQKPHLINVSMRDTDGITFTPIGEIEYKFDEKNLISYRGHDGLTHYGQTMTFSFHTRDSLLGNFSAHSIVLEARLALIETASKEVDLFPYKYEEEESTYQPIDRVDYYKLLERRDDEIEEETLPRMGCYTEVVNKNIQLSRENERMRIKIKKLRDLYLAEKEIKSYVTKTLIDENIDFNGKNQKLKDRLEKMESVIKDFQAKNDTDKNLIDSYIKALVKHFVEDKIKVLYDPLHKIFNDVPEIKAEDIDESYNKLNLDNGINDFFLNRTTFFDEIGKIPRVELDSPTSTQSSASTSTSAPTSTSSNTNNDLQDAKKQGSLDAFIRSFDVILNLFNIQKIYEEEELNYNSMFFSRDLGQTVSFSTLLNVFDHLSQFHENMNKLEITPTQNQDTTTDDDNVNLQIFKMIEDIFSDNPKKRNLYFVFSQLPSQLPSPALLTITKICELAKKHIELIELKLKDKEMAKASMKLKNPNKKMNVLFGDEYFEIFYDALHLNRIDIHNILKFSYFKNEKDPENIKYEFIINFGYSQLIFSADRFFYKTVKDGNFIEGSDPKNPLMTEILNKPLVISPTPQEIVAYLSRFSEKISQLCLASLSEYIGIRKPFKLKLISTNCRIGAFTYKYQLLTNENISDRAYNQIGNDFPFYKPSISWCIKNYDGKSGILIFRSILSDDSRATQDRFTLKILKNYALLDQNELINNVLFSPNKNKNLLSKIDDKNKLGINKSETIDLEFSTRICYLLEKYKNEGKYYLNAEFIVHLTKWLSNSFQCCQQLSQGNNVIIEDIDHIPVTIFIGSLSKIMMDPEYCTFKGFIGLIQTDWINRGYFYMTNESLPLSNRLYLFYAWLVCVECLQCKYPEKFEFTFWMIQYVINNIWVDRFFPFSRNSTTEEDIFQKLNINMKYFKHCAYCIASASIYNSLLSEINQPMSLLSNLHLPMVEKIFADALDVIKTNINMIEVSKLRNNNYNLMLLDYVFKGEILNFIANTHFDLDSNTKVAIERLILKGQREILNFIPTLSENNQTIDPQNKDEHSESDNEDDEPKKNSDIDPSS